MRVRGGLPWVAGVLVLCAAAIGADPPRIAVDGEDDDWSDAQAVQDLRGDARGPGGSDILSVSASNDERNVYVLIRVAGLPNVEPSTITYNVDFSLSAEFYNRRCCFWGDGVDLRGAILYQWASKDAEVVSAEAPGARAVAGSVVEMQVPFALMGGIFTSPIWIKVSSADHATGIAIDEVQFQYLPTGTLGGGGTKEIGVLVDGDSKEWEAGGALLVDARDDSTGGAGSELIRAGLASDADRLYVMMQVDGKPSIAADALSYCVDVAVDADRYDTRIAVCGDGTRLTHSRLHRWSGTEATSAGEPADGVHAAAAGVVEVSVPFTLLGGRWSEPRRVRLCVCDRATGTRLDEIQVRYAAAASPDTHVADSWIPPAHIGLPQAAKVGQFSEYALRGRARERWAVVGEEGGRLLVEHRLGSPGAARVHRFLVEPSGLVRRAWAGCSGGVGVERPMSGDGGEEGEDPFEIGRGGLRRLDEAADTLTVACGTFVCRRIRYVRADEGADPALPALTTWIHPTVQYPWPLPAGMTGFGSMVQCVDADGHVLLELTGNGTDARPELTTK